jgi:hypothetical protein
MITERMRWSRDINPRWSGEDYPGMGKNGLDAGVHDRKKGVTLFDLTP